MSQIRVLILEDNPLDAELAVHHLKRAGLDPEWRRVDTQTGYLAGLEWNPDVVLADYNLPQFDGIRAITLLKERELDIPLILVSGTMGEDLAVEAIKRGAHDYLLKDRLMRLGEAVRHAIDEKHLRTERAAAEQALRRSEARHRLVSEVVSDYAYSLAVGPDGSMNCEWVTDAFTRILGFTLEDVNRRGWLQLWHAEDRRLIEQHHQRLFAGESADIDIRILTKDGETRWVRLYECPIWDEAEQRTVTIIGAAQDYTARRQLEQQLLQAQKMEAIGRLAGGVAHDFNNLLTVILGYSTMLRADAPEGSALGLGLDEIQKAGEHAATLTRQLLTFSRRQPTELKTIDLNALLDSLRRMLVRLIGEDIQLANVPGADLWPIAADPGQIEQVVLNLAINSRDAMPQGGTLTIETANCELGPSSLPGAVPIAAGPYVMLSIRDTGCGMDAETQSHIFEPFFTTKEKGKGTGLGLSTVYGIVQQLKGQIVVSSEVGRGTCIRVYFPKNAVRSQALTENKPEETPKGKEQILLVEDEARVRLIVRKWLRGLGYRVLEAGDAETALSLETKNVPIHLLISDVVLPKISGPDLAATLRELRPDIGVLFISGYADEVSLPKLSQVPGALFLPKPFTREALAQKIREVLAAPRLRETGAIPPSNHKRKVPAHL